MTHKINHALYTDALSRQNFTRNFYPQVITGVSLIMHNFINCYYCPVVFILITVFDI